MSSDRRAARVNPDSTLHHVIGEEHLEAVKAKIKTGDSVVAVDPYYYRPAEVELLIGNAAKARKTLGWEPKYDLQGLVEDMMQSDVKLMKKEIGNDSLVY